jgi:PTH1 family peptidyl-tRNA hydrolase
MNTLIVGLGNPGFEYAKTRHNIGFQVLNSLLQNKIFSKKFHGLIFKENDIVFLKPETFMNLSGKSVLACKQFFKPEKILVIHDEIEFPYGKIQFKFAGSDSGHNGLRSISELCGKDYYRLRIGIGKKHPVDEYVLSNFTEDISDLLHLSCEAVNSFLNSPFEDVCKLYNNRSIV